MPGPDDPSVILTGIREYIQAAFLASGPALSFMADPPAAVVMARHAKSLLAAVEAVLKHHVPRTEHHADRDSFHYCSTCSGHPKWPCPEVRAITSALTGVQDGTG